MPTLAPPPAPSVARRPRAILIAGATGKLGRELTRACALRGLDIMCPTRTELDITDARQVEDVIARHRPWAVVNAAALSAARDETGARALFSINSLGAENLARACARHELAFMTFSSDRVFDGGLERPYVEGDDHAPSCLLGLSKAEGERRVALAHGEALIIRMSQLFGCEDDPAPMLQRWARRFGSGTFFTATYLPDVVRVALDLLVDGETGTWHLANQGAVSLDEMARIFPLQESCATPQRRLVMLGSERALLMPSLTESLMRQKDVLARRQSQEPWPVAAE